jgi:putative spermidine/putrescine transport system substrate-binding protein
MALAFHKQKLGFEPTKRSDLLRPEVKGQVGLYDASYMSLYTFACIKVDQDNKPGTAAAEVASNLSEVLHFARAHADIVQDSWWPNSTTMLRWLEERHCLLGNMHSPEMLEAMAERPDLGAVVPAEDRAFVQVMWAIPDGTPHKDLAEQAIDVIFSNDVQRGFTRYGSATAILEVARQAAEDRLWKSLYPSTEEGLRRLRYYPYEVYAEHAVEISDFWNREVLRKA